MADVHNFVPTAAQLAAVAGGEAARHLEGPINSLEACLRAAFATSGKDRPARLDPNAIIVLLAEAVVRQGQELESLRAEVAGLRTHARELDSRTMCSVVMGPAAAHARQDRDNAKRARAVNELRAKLAADPEWAAGRQRLSDALAARREARDTQDVTAAPPHPAGGTGE